MYQKFYTTAMCPQKKIIEKRFTMIKTAKHTKKFISVISACVAMLVLVTTVFASGVLSNMAGVYDNDKQEIKTNIFSVLLPNQWEITSFSSEDSMFSMDINNKEICYADIRNYNYYIDENDAPHFGDLDNHSKKIVEKKLTGFTAPVYSLIIEHTQPAAAMDDTVVTLEHSLFLNKEYGYVINLAIDTDLVNEKDRMEIAKSLIMNESPIPHGKSGAENLADIWANAWMTRDGKSRYEIMSESMKQEFENEQLRVNGEDGSPWVIRWSSPWVVSYSIEVNEDKAVINYEYTDSTTAIYQGTESITIGYENGRSVVVSHNDSNIIISNN
ncbi:MAG: hypothetical protein PHE51_12775 [Eubacteriales bacterium]|nr:hypothetical protein [Eubacteriales bacterium]